MIKISLAVMLILTLCSTGNAAGVEDIPDIELGWDIPTERTDGSALPITEIDHYNIYYGSGTIEIAADQTGYTVVDVGVGVHTFTISTVDLGGIEGPISEEVSVTIAELPSPPAQIPMTAVGTCSLQCNFEVK